MKKQIFSRGLFCEGLRRPRLPGILFLIIAMLSACLPAVFYAVNHTGSDVVSAPLLASWLLPVLFLAPFSLVYTLLSFLNSRGGSDFYHALPQPRVSLFLSFAAAAAVWLSAIVAAPILSAALIYTVSGARFVPSTIPWAIFTMLAGILLVEACALLAMSVTGTVFSNLVLYGLLLFLPRFFATMFNLSLYSGSQIVSIRHTAGLLNPNWNIPVKLFLSLGGSVFGVDTGNRLYMSLPAIVYTLALALLYGGFACLCFRLRRSEAAGNSAPTRALQHVYRLAIALPVALVIPAVVVSAQANSSLTWGSVGPGLTTLTVVSLLIYYLFELITTKKARNLVSATPWLLVLVGLDLVFGLTLGNARAGLLRFQPSADEVAGVTLSPSDSTGYNALKMGRVEIRGEAVRADVVKLLKENIADIKSGAIVNPYRYDVVFHMKNGAAVYRTLYFPKDETSVIYKDLETDRTYVNAQVSLPEDGNILQVNCGGLSKMNARKLWEVFRDEYSSLDYKEQIAYSEFPYKSQELPPVTGLTVQGNLGSDSFRNDYNLSARTPKSAALYIQLMNSANESNFRSTFRGSLTNATVYLQLFNRPAQETHQSYSFTPGISNASINASLSALLLRNAGKTVNILEPYLAVEVYEKSKPTESISYFVPISQPELTTLDALNPENK